MVCIPCIVIPLVLWVFHRFIQPFVYPLLPERVKSWFNFNMRIYGVTPPKGSAEGSGSEAGGGDGQSQNPNGTEKENEYNQESTTRTGCPFKPNGVQATTVGGDKKTD